MEILNVLAYHCYYLVVFMGTSVKSFPRKYLPPVDTHCRYQIKGIRLSFSFKHFLLLLESTYLGMGVHIFLWHFSLYSLGQRHGMEKNLAIKYYNEGKRKEWFPTRLAISVVFRWINLARLPTCKSGCNQFCDLKLTKVKNYRNYKQNSKNISSVSDFLNLCLLWFTALFLWWSNETYLSWQ